MNCEIKMPQNFLTLKYISFYFVNLQDKTMSDKNDKNFVMEILLFSDASRNFLGILFSSSVTPNAPVPNGS